MGNYAKMPTIIITESNQLIIGNRWCGMNEDRMCMISFHLQYPTTRASLYIPCTASPRRITRIGLHTESTMISISGTFARMAKHGLSASSCLLKHSQ